MGVVSGLRRYSRSGHDGPLPGLRGTAFSHADAASNLDDYR